MSAPPADGASAPVLGVLVPCRNEARVIERKLANLEVARWPTSGRRHRVCVVDDGSTDGTGDLAREVAERSWSARPDLDLEVVPNEERPGKAGAIATGLGVLDGVDLVVLTDADVVLHPGALEALAAAFGDRRVGMASGAQVFVRELAADGSVRGPGGGPLLPAGDLFDRGTALVRRLESCFGALFSVHGQLLAWRAGLGLAPTPGIAADDIDLALGVRALGGRVVLVRDATFYEEKPSSGPRGDDQAIRRARAYLQVVRHPRDGRLGRLARLQLALYRLVPPAVPELVALALVASVLATLASGRPLVALALLAGAIALGITPAGRRVLRLFAIIRAARRLERQTPLSDRWEMERT